MVVLKLGLMDSAFTEAILVTPMGALSVVICAILSHFFLKESLTFFVSSHSPQRLSEHRVGSDAHCV